MDDDDVDDASNHDDKYADSDGAKVKNQHHGSVSFKIVEFIT